LLNTRNPAQDVNGHGHYSPDQGDRDRMIAVDADLPLTVPESGLTGLDEMSKINQAVGRLIAQGHGPSRAEAVLPAVEGSEPIPSRPVPSGRLSRSHPLR
jgi:hypothetical protein